MKAVLVLILAGMFSFRGIAQPGCVTQSYQAGVLTSGDISKTEDFISRQFQQARITGGLIRIPVVIHNLYHYPMEKITTEQAAAQLKVLNDCFRRRNQDTTNTPAVFKPFAADIEIEFVLARRDPAKRATTGIVRKYTPVTQWGADDKMKFSSMMGDDAWDPNSYLNIWVCNLDRFAGYSSFPGGPLEKDGIVLDLDAFGSPGKPNTMAKTIVHEAGHWLGLKHLWGDQLCGDDLVDDTPKQASYTPGCPKTIRITCGNGPNGDMYMNYMDFTSDACTNLFTLGQKNRMRSLFNPGGPRAAILDSKGLQTPVFLDAPLEGPDPKWLQARLYPNPATSGIILDLSYDVRWVGSEVRITNAMGQPVMKSIVSSKQCQVDVSSLKPGVYFLDARRGDGEKMLFRFVKLN
jgi:hypothetical protein